MNPSDAIMFTSTQSTYLLATIRMCARTFPSLEKLFAMFKNVSNRKDEMLFFSHVILHSFGFAHVHTPFLKASVEFITSASKQSNILKKNSARFFLSSISLVLVSSFPAFVFTRALAKLSKKLGHRFAGPSEVMA